MNFGNTEININIHFNFGSQPWLVVNDKIKNSVNLKYTSFSILNLYKLNLIAVPQGPINKL